LSTTKASSAQKEVIDRFAQAISTQSGLEANCFDSDLLFSALANEPLVIVTPGTAGEIGGSRKLVFFLMREEQA
jgi:hypothetical protein